MRSDSRPLLCSGVRSWCGDLHNITQGHSLPPATGEIFADEALCRAKHSIPDCARFRSIIAEAVAGWLRACRRRFGGQDMRASMRLRSCRPTSSRPTVHNTHLARRRAKLLRRIIDFANDMGIRLVVEGTESGDFYGRPPIGARLAGFPRVSRSRGSARSWQAPQIRDLLPEVAVGEFDSV